MEDIHVRPPFRAGNFTLTRDSVVELAKHRPSFIEVGPISQLVTFHGTTVEYTFFYNEKEMLSVRVYDDGTYSLEEIDENIHTEGGVECHQKTAAS